MLSVVNPAVVAIDTTWKNAWLIVIKMCIRESPYSVNLATEYKSLTHYTKGTQSPHKELSLINIFMP